MINVLKNELVDFEKDIAKLYEEGKIKGPIHLRDGNEQQLIDIFKNIKEDDYVFCTWANHLHAALKGVPLELIKQRIIDCESMAMNFPEYKFFTSSIVSGISPISTGTALSIKRLNQDNKVWCFLGDMAFRTGISHESIMFAISNNLPITFVVEDNNKSVGTPTQDSWGSIRIKDILYFYQNMIEKYKSNTQIMYYEYKLSYPHSGTGTFVTF